ncbi:MAG: preprotein translocase subunit SecG [Bacteroidales bacterium]|nr:preprotein translocase subunit SecG [Bacteroidales bacterium]
MNAMFITLTTLVIIASVLITLVVLLQNGKGDGLASNFVAGNQTFGVRQTADILEKITWGLCVVILVLSICTAFVAGGKRDKVKAEVTESVESAAQPEEGLDFEAAEEAVEEAAEVPADAE